MKAGITLKALRSARQWKRYIYVFIGQTFEDQTIKKHTCDLKAIKQGLINGYIIGICSPKGNVKRIKPFYFHK
jgi:hypothetical protein